MAEEESRRHYGGLRAIGSFGQGAFGPTIFLTLTSREAVVWLRDVFLSMAESNAPRDLVAEPRIVVRGVERLELRRASGAGRKQLTSHKRGRSFIWSTDEDRWRANAELLEPFIVGQSGHQYLTSEGIDDALVVISYGEPDVVSLGIDRRAVKRTRTLKKLLRRLRTILLRRTHARTTSTAEHSRELDSRTVWSAVWRPRHSPERHVAYWITGGDGAEDLAYRGPTNNPPKHRGDPVFVIRGNRAYRAWGHPDGPSSVPYLEIRGGTVRPGEGYPGGRSARRLYRVARWDPPDRPGVTIRPTPNV
jgi:hypothetical protein